MRSFNSFPFRNSRCSDASKPHSCAFTNGEDRASVAASVLLSHATSRHENLAFRAPVQLNSRVADIKPRNAQAPEATLKQNALQLLVALPFELTDCQ